MNIQEFNQEIDKYDLDRDIPNKFWSKYLNLFFCKEYQTYKCRATYPPQPQLRYIDVPYWIKSGIGHIDVYSIKHRELIFVLDSRFTQRKISNLKKKLPKFCEVIQQTKDCLVVKFCQDKIKELVDVFEIRKKRKCTEEQRLRLIEQLRKARNQKKRGLNKEE